MKQFLIALTMAAAAALGVTVIGDVEGPSRSSSVEIRSEPPPSPARQASVTPAGRPSQSAAPIAQPPRLAAKPAPQATAAPLPTVVYVANTDGQGVFVRWSPALEDKVKAYPDGARLDVVGPERAADGVTWLYVRAADGLVGWVPKQYTTARPPTPAPG